MTETTATPEAQETGTGVTPEPERKGGEPRKGMRMAVSEPAPKAETETKDGPDTAAETDAEPEPKASEDGTEEGTPEAEKPKRKPKPKAEERIRDLAHEKRKLELEKARMEGELAGLRQAGTAQAKDQTADGKPEPEPGAEADPRPEYGQFDSPDAFHEAVARWSARQEWKVLQEQAAEEKKVLQLREKRAIQQKQWEKQAAKAREAHEDWDEVFNDPSVPCSAEMADAIFASDFGAEVAYYLGRAPEEAARIAQLDAIGAAREIGKIEARLETTGSGKTPEKTNAGADSDAAPKRATRADAPITPPKGGGKAAPDLEYLATHNFAEYQRVRNKQYDDYLRRRGIIS